MMKKSLIRSINCASLNYGMSEYATYASDEHVQAALSETEEAAG